MIYFVKFFAYLHGFFHKYFSVNIRGLGFFYRLVKRDLIFKVKSKKMFFNHKISDNYGLLVNGMFNEVETHLFLDYIFNNSNTKVVNFVDVGGNVGEFVLDYSDHKNINKLTVFEPQLEQQIAITKTIQLNNFNKATLVPKALSIESGEILFNFNLNNSTASGITKDSKVGKSIIATTIDDYFTNYKNEEFVFLIDTEGAELDILKGGARLIAEVSPLIIFEYNFVTKQSFSLDDMKLYLGSNYELFRLRKDGKLDKDFSICWNVVAVHKSSSFFQSVNKLIK